jgi:hypothetical protein
MNELYQMSLRQPLRIKREPSINIAGGLQVRVTEQLLRIRQSNTPFFVQRIGDLLGT